MMAASDAIPIYKDQDFFVPQFEIRIKGRELASDVVRDVLQVTYKDDVEAIDSFEFTINNWDAAKQTFKYSDTDLFDPGSKIELTMGYFGPDKQRRMLTGEITSLTPTFPSGGQPTLAVSGLNLLHQFRREQVSKTYEKKKDSQIAKEIGQRLGVQVKTDANAARSETEHPIVFQDQLDIVFLMLRAQKNGYDLMVTEDDKPTLYFGPSQNVKQVTYELIYGRSLIEFSPSLTTANQVNEVVVRGWDAKNKTKIEGKATRSQLKEPGTLKRTHDSFKKKKEVITNHPIHSKAEADRLALETLRRISKDMVIASGKTIGLPDLRAGGAIKIDGIGQRFAGRYFLTKTSHSISDSGYITSFDCRREDS